MLKPLLCVLAAGIGLGLMWPTGEAPSATEPAAHGGRAEAAVTRLPRQRNGHFYVDATVNGRHVRFLVDTGASMVALTTADAERVGEAFNPARFDVVGTGASGPVQGENIRIDTIEIQGKRVANVSGAVIEGLEVSLLGQAYLSRMDIAISGDEMAIREGRRGPSI